LATHATAQLHGEVINPSTGLSNRKLLMWAFLGSDVMFFGAFIGTYLIYRGQSLVGPYPKDILNIPITSISTFVLLMSSLGIVLALYYLKEARYSMAKVWLFLVVAMGVTFLGFQVFEFNEFAHEGLTPRTNMFGTTFFILTGLHGAHVTFGVLWLSVLLFNEAKGALTSENAIDLEIAGLYWHFVDIVWIVIFTVIYLISANDGGAPGSLPFTH
jgi:cytochrome c oxidase subunit 3